MNGGIETDFPLTVTGRVSRRSLNGTIGSGGRQLELSTVNGSIELKRAGGKELDALRASARVTGGHREARAGRRVPSFVFVQGCLCRDAVARGRSLMHSPAPWERQD